MNLLQTTELNNICYTPTLTYYYHHPQETWKFLNLTKSLYNLFWIYHLLLSSKKSMFYFAFNVIWLYLTSIAFAQTVQFALFPYFCWEKSCHPLNSNSILSSHNWKPHNILSRINFSIHCILLTHLTLFYEGSH